MKQQLVASVTTVCLLVVACANTQAAEQTQSEANAMASAKQSLVQGNWDALVRFAGDLAKDPQHAVVASNLFAHARYMQGHYNESLKNPVSSGSSGPRPKTSE